MTISETQKKILAVGKKEFLKKGFKDASLRIIVEEAGFTKGAFYGYYPNKAALFEAIVSDVADGLIEQFKAAQDAHFDLIPENKTLESRELSTKYLLHFVNYIYDYFEEFKLVICCSEGTKYEDYIHELVELEVSCTEKYYAILKEKGKMAGNVSHDLHHMITSAYFTAVFETIVHDMTREQAIKYVKELAVFFNSGWDGLLRFK
ncbi:TPA: TetR/AcrR family transcriptional regulator [Streptococcus agalactiae]